MSHVSCIAGGFFTTSATWEACIWVYMCAYVSVFVCECMCANVCLAGCECVPPSTVAPSP